MNINTIITFPEETQLQILQYLDSKSLFLAGSSCKLWYRISTAAIDALFQKECNGERYDNGEILPGECKRVYYALNQKIIAAAKKFLHVASDYSPFIRQYQKLKVNSIQNITRPIRPANLIQVSPCSLLLYSEEGCRLQNSLERDKVSLKKISLPGSIIGAHSNSKELFFLYENEISVLFKTGASEVALACKPGEIRCHAFQGDALVYATANSLISYPSGRSTYSNSIEWLGFLETGEIIAYAKNTLRLFSTHLEILDTHEIVLKKPPLIQGEKVFLLFESDELFSWEPHQKQIISIKEDVCDILPLSSDKFLLHSQERIELWSHGKPLYKIEGVKMGTAAAEKEGFLALAFEDTVAIFSLDKKSGLIPFEGRGGIHALLFTNALELFVTTKDGSIFSLCPFLK